MPPSRWRICPVIQEDLGESKKKVASAISSGEPTLPKGCLLSEASFFSGVERSIEAKGVSVSDGEMVFTLILEEAHSAARDLHRPSTAPLAEAMPA